MIKRLLLPALFFSVISFCGHAQIIFEPGYFIGSDQQKIECLIKNVDWKNNPTKFEYKLTQDGEVRTGNISSVQEFRIHGYSKYVRAAVRIDRSSNLVAELSSEPAPDFQDEELFLKVLIEGKASLFKYQEDGLTRYFFSTTGTNIEQLVFKRYITTRNQIASINTFRQQLFMNLKCDDITREELERINYQQKPITALFTRYNRCMGEELSLPESKERKTMFNLSLRPGVNLSSLSVDSPYDVRDVQFDNQINFRAGLELELVLPFNKNKWAIIVEPTYQYFKSEVTSPSGDMSGGTFTATVDYQSIEIPVGVRHYFFLNDQSKIFINVAMIFDSSFSSSIEYVRSDNSYLQKLEVKSSSNFAAGAGYKFKNRLALELRFQSYRQLSPYVSWSSKYNTSSIILGYTLF